MAPRDQFPSRGGLDSAVQAFAIIAADTDLAQIPRALWVGTGGDLALLMDGVTVTLTNVPDGTLVPVRPTQVKAATTASEIVGLV